MQLFLTIWLCVLSVAASAASENPLEWQFRLADGPTGLSGRIEMRPNSTAPWGTICSDLFKEDNYGPIAACNSAGLVGVTQAAFVSTFGPGTGPIYLTDVACTASTNFIQNCSRSPLLLTGACVHYEDAGVECSPPINQWAFKMVNGTAPSNGVVLLRPMPSLAWGMVYDFNFLYNSWVFNREVMCRMLGYNTSKATSMDPRSLDFPTDYSFPSYLYVYGCSDGTVPHIGLCQYGQFGSSSWSGYNALALDCNPPPPKPVGPVTVKLLNGVTPWSGMIWISPNASEPWYGLAAEDLTSNPHGSPMITTAQTLEQLNVLRAVCASAGFPNATNPIFGKYGYVSPPPTEWGYTRLIGMGVNCSGNPGTTLSNCSVGPDLYTGYSRVTQFYGGVDCFPTTHNFSNWLFRFGGGSSNATSGRVELRPKDNASAPWLGVCGNNEFNANGVLWTALCRTMGFNTNYGMRSREPSTTLGTSMYYLGLSEYPYCPSIGGLGRTLEPNKTLQDCSLSPIGMHQCSPGSELMLDCGFPDPSLAEMRLVDGTKPGAGRLEMRPSPNYDWGTIGDLWQANMGYQWEVYNALVICWSLGFLNVTNPILTMSYGPGNFSQPIWWSLISCGATDTNFSLCTGNFPFGFTYDYGHYYDVGVDCYPPPFDMIVTLEAGDAPWKGRIMLQYTSYIAIGSVCNDLFKHNHFAWNAACRSAGFENVTKARYQSFGPADSNVPISVDDVVCSPTDLFLQNCTHRPFGQHNCFHGEDAGVDCYPPPEDTTVWEFRLADGTSSTNGRLEMRPGSTFGWGSVCAGPYFNHTVAAWKAACRQVGIMNPPRARWRYFPKGSDTVYLDNVSCNAGDLFLVPNCTMFPLGSYRCDPTEVAGVDCNAPAEVPSAWQFRLTDGRSSTSGRLEMRPDGTTPWGAVCRRGLTNFEAVRAVCRSAGHPTATRPAVYRPLAPPPSTLPFYLDQAVCNASTRYLHNCTYAPLYSHDCSVEAGDALYIECFPTGTAAATVSPSRSLAPRRTLSRPMTPTGGWPRALTATLTITDTRSRPSTRSKLPKPSTTRSGVLTASVPRRHTQSRTLLPPRTHSRIITKSLQALPSMTRAGLVTTSASATRSMTGSVTVVPSLTVPFTTTFEPTTTAMVQPPSTTMTAVAAARARSLTSSVLSRSYSQVLLPTQSKTLPKPPQPCGGSALDFVLGTTLLRPLSTAYLAWPPTSITAPVAFSFSAEASVLLPLEAGTATDLAPAHLVDPLTLRPVGGSVVSVVVRRFGATLTALNASLAIVTDATDAATVLPPGSVVLVAVPSVSLLQCGATGNMTVIGRLVLVDALLFGGGAAGGVPPRPPPAREAEAPVSYQSAAAAEEVAALLLACERGGGITSMAFFRMLSPFATGPAHAMVLAGSAAVTGLVLGAQVLTVVWMRARGKAKSLLACAAAARAPAITIAVAEPLWFGVAYAGASLVVGAANGSALQILAGVGACASTVAIPVLVVLGLRRYASRRIIAYKRVYPHPIPACLAPHIAPTTRVKPEALVKVLAPLVSFRSLHPLLPALGSLSPAVTAIIVLLTGAIPGLCRVSHLLIALAHILLAVAVAAIRPRRTTLLNAFATLQHLSIALVFGWAALLLAVPMAVGRAEAVLYTFIVIQTGVVGCRIALTPLAFFSDRLLPYKGVRAIAEYIAPAAERKDPLEFMPGHPDYFRDDEDRRLHNVDDDPILSSDEDVEELPARGGLGSVLCMLKDTTRNTGGLDGGAGGPPRSAGSCGNLRATSAKEDPRMPLDLLLRPSVVNIGQHEEEDDPFSSAGTPSATETESDEDEHRQVL